MEQDAELLKVVRASFIEKENLSQDFKKVRELAIQISERRAF